MLRSVGSSPRFLVAYLNHVSHTLSANMQNFLPWILPANPAWSSNRASDHTSEVDIKWVHIGSTDAPGPSSKTSKWCHAGIKKFNFVSNGHISAQKNRFVGKEGAMCRLQMIPHPRIEPNLPPTSLSPGKNLRISRYHSHILHPKAVASHYHHQIQTNILPPMFATFDIA